VQFILKPGPFSQGLLRLFLIFPEILLPEDLIECFYLRLEGTGVKDNL
jgi:hypothetical protein